MLRRTHAAGFVIGLGVTLLTTSLTWAQIGGDVPEPTRIRGGFSGRLPASTAAKAKTTGVAAEEELATTPGMVNVRFADGSMVKLALQQETYELATSYGKLSIPAEEIRLVELAPRVPDEVARQIEEAVANLGSPQFEIREKAMADLVKIGPLGYPVLIRFAKTKDLEVAARMEEVLEKVRARLPEDQAESREWDIVHTQHSRIAGRLEVKVVKAESPQFGQVELKLADVRDLRFHGANEEIDLSKLENAPTHLYDKQDQIGKTFTWKIKGNAAAGTLWGTDTYTLDSALAAAVVHAGVVKDGQAGAVRVKIVDSPAAFSGTTRNGVTSHDYGMYPAAYKIIKTR